MNSVTRSIVISIAERYLLIALQLASFVIIARLLTPSDVGLYSVAAALIAVAQILRDFGVGSYLIQEQELTATRLRTAFTVTLAISVAVFAAIQAAAGAIAHFYNDDRLETVLRTLAVIFLLIPLNSTTMAVLRREMKFGVLAAINIASVIVGTASSITLAYLGYGYNSLVWASIASTLTTVAGGALYRRSEFFLKPCLAEWRRVFSFGSQVALTNVLAQVAVNFNDLVVGRALGFAAVGILSRAQGTMNLFHRDLMEAIRNVAYPAFARAHREGADMDAIHARAVTAVTVLAWPFYGFLTLYPLECLRLLFGPQWDAAAPLVPILCAAGAIAATWNLVSNLVTAAGQVGLATRAELWIQPMRLVLLLACAVLFDELAYFAIVLLVVYAAHFVNIYWHKGQALPTDWGRLRTGLRASATVALPTLLPAALVRAMTDPLWRLDHVLWLIPALGALTALSWVLSLRLLQHPLTRDPLVPDRIRYYLSPPRNHGY